MEQTLRRRFGWIRDILKDAVPGGGIAFSSIRARVSIVLTEFGAPRAHSVQAGIRLRTQVSVITTGPIDSLGIPAPRFRITRIQGTGVPVITLSRFSPDANPFCRARISHRTGIPVRAWRILFD